MEGRRSLRSAPAENLTHGQRGVDSKSALAFEVPIDTIRPAFADNRSEGVRCLPLQKCDSYHACEACAFESVIAITLLKG